MPGNKENLLFLDNTLRIFRSLDSSLPNLTRRIRLYCVGGTKLIFDDVKSSSKDIDIIASRNDFRLIGHFIAELYQKEGIRIDVFPEAEFTGFSIPLYAEGAYQFPHNFSQLDLYSLGDPYFVLTKALAGRPRDIQELLDFYKKHYVGRDSLEKAFGNLRIKPDYEISLRNKLDDFIKACYSSN